MPDHHSIARVIESLHIAAIDARHGYEEGVKDAGSHGMSPLFHEMITVHTKNAADLAPILERMGEDTDDDGSIMSLVNETIMGVRSIFGGLGPSVLPGLIDGERRNVDQYRHALETPGLSPDLGAVLTTNRDRLMTAIEAMRAIEP